MKFSKTNTMNFKALFICGLIFSFFTACAQEKKENDVIIKKIKTDYDYEVIAPNLENPWGFAFLSDKSILITEKSGKLLHFKDNKATVIKNVPEVYLRGQGGLLDVKLHPKYKENGWIYKSKVK